MTPAFDQDELMERVDDDLEFLEETVEMLEEDAPDLVGKIRTAIEAGDAAALATSAHTLKGLVSNFCAEPAGEAALALETMGREQTLDAAADAMTALERETERLQADLRTFLASKTA